MPRRPGETPGAPDDARAGGRRVEDRRGARARRDARRTRGRHPADCRLDVRGRLEEQRARAPGSPDAGCPGAARRDRDRRRATSRACAAAAAAPRTGGGRRTWTARRCRLEEHGLERERRQEPVEGEPPAQRPPGHVGPRRGRDEVHGVDAALARPARESRVEAGEVDREEHVGRLLAQARERLDAHPPPEADGADHRDDAHDGVLGQVPIERRARLRRGRSRVAAHVQPGAEGAQPLDHGRHHAVARGLAGHEEDGATRPRRRLGPRQRRQARRDPPEPASLPRPEEGHRIGESRIHNTTGRIPSSVCTSSHATRAWSVRSRPRRRG